jgi:hypothetical protein
VRGRWGAHGRRLQFRVTCALWCAGQARRLHNLFPCASQTPYKVLPETDSSKVRRELGIKDWIKDDEAYNEMAQVCHLYDVAAGFGDSSVPHPVSPLHKSPSNQPKPTHSPPPPPSPPLAPSPPTPDRDCHVYVPLDPLRGGPRRHRAVPPRDVRCAYRLHAASVTPGTGLQGPYSIFQCPRWVDYFQPPQGEGVGAARSPGATRPKRLGRSSFTHSPRAVRPLAQRTR